MADTVDDVRAGLADCDVVFHYGEPKDALRANWGMASSLRWLHIAGVGVDWTLFPEVVDSDVLVTNSHGVFDTTLPEYVLALMLAMIKDLPGTFRFQTRREWNQRLQVPLAGSRAVLVGAGSIGRSTGRVLRGLGVEVTLVGRTERDGADGEGRIRAVAELHDLLPGADWLLLITPLTESTRGLIGAAELARLPAHARLVNIGRGKVVVEAQLIDALQAGALAGAALDVFEEEPLPEASPLWSMPNVIVSPHVGGDVQGTPEAFSRVFQENLARYLAGQPLHNVVDKQLGYPPSY
jgi:phosphoglycerate dehydrogenase-like enzyme